MQRKHYWLTPPELWARLRAEFGDDLYDPCPYPRPLWFNGLTVPWGRMNYVNAPFYGEVVDGTKYGMTAWARKAVEEQRKGKTSLIVYPFDGWVHVLVNAGAELRSIGDVKWLATEDLTAQPSSHQIIMFVLRGSPKRFPRFENRGTIVLP